MREPARNSHQQPVQNHQLFELDHEINRQKQKTTRLLRLKCPSRMGQDQFPLVDRPVAGGGDIGVMGVEGTMGPMRALESMG